MMDRRCERCGKKHLAEFVWLELNAVTGRYGEPGSVPPNESQGLFPFGATCARRETSSPRGVSTRHMEPLVIPSKNKQRLHESEPSNTGRKRRKS
jgi:hypothetical protein